MAVIIQDRKPDQHSNTPQQQVIITFISNFMSTFHTHLQYIHFHTVVHTHVTLADIYYFYFHFFTTLYTHNKYTSTLFYIQATKANIYKSYISCATVYVLSVESWEYSLYSSLVTRQLHTEVLDLSNIKAYSSTIATTRKYFVHIALHV
jgi:hypothetical protein